MITETQTALKQQLLRECMRLQQEQINNAKSAMNEAQESANEQQGSMEDKFESFREACQIQRDMFARQMAEFVSGLNTLKKIVVTKKQIMPVLGAVVITDAQKLFISLSLGQITVNGEQFFATSGASPLCKAMEGKKEGETFTFRDKKYKIKELF